MAFSIQCIDTEAAAYTHGHSWSFWRSHVKARFERKCLSPVENQPKIRFFWENGVRMKNLAEESWCNFGLGLVRVGLGLDLGLMLLASASSTSGLVNIAVTKSVMCGQLVTPDLWLLYRWQSISAISPVPNYTACAWSRSHRCK